jgi:UDPglucose 6-dehydrogenase
VGLTTVACLSHLGHRVTCMDKDEGRIRGLEEGRIPFYEPGLEELMAKNASRLRFGTKLDGVVREADAIFIAVDTPQGEDGAADLSNVAAVARSIGRALAQEEEEGGRKGSARSWWSTRARFRWEAGTTSRC